MKRNQQIRKDSKLHPILNGYLDFRKFWFLTAKKQNIDFSKVNAQKMKIYISSICYITHISICCRDMCHQHVYKISSQYNYFWLCNGTKIKYPMVMTSLFNSIFRIYNRRTTKQMIFFNHETKLDKIDML